MIAARGFQARCGLSRRYALLFGVILAVTFIQFRFFRNRTTYEVA